MLHPLVAHQGGWDEILYLAIPAAAVFFWVRWAEKRARRRSAGSADESGASIAESSDAT